MAGIKDFRLMALTLVKHTAVCANDNTMLACSGGLE